MQPVFERIAAGVGQSFYVNHMVSDSFPSPLHFHPEIEILLIIEGSGTRVTGDGVGRFSPGELVMIGSNVPHVWYSDQINNTIPEKKPETIYIQFLKDFTGERFFHLPESEKIRDLFELAKRGIKLYGRTRDRVEELMHKLTGTAGMPNIIILLNILHTISSSKEIHLLSGPVIQTQVNLKNSSRMNRIYRYVLENYNEEITLNDIAMVANLSPSAFSRYFKSNTNKTFVQFLNEVRVGHARQLLRADEQYPISNICYLCGFNSPSYFIRQFRKITGATPLEYRKKVAGNFTS
jgi:AraC-like DNA-binding protein